MPSAELKQAIDGFRPADELVEHQWELHEATLCKVLALLKAKIAEAVSGDATSASLILSSGEVGAGNVWRLRNILVEKGYAVRSRISAETVTLHVQWELPA